MATTLKMSVFKPVFIDQRVALTPLEFREAASDIDGFLLAKMKKDLDGQCCIHGYVREGSMQIVARSMGQAEHGRFTGDFLYYCKIRIDCLTLHEGQVVEGQVIKANKMGAYALLTEGEQTLEAVRVLLPREFHVGSAEFDGLEPGTRIRMKILRSRFQKNDAFIQAAGTLETVSGPGLVTGPVKALLPAVTATEA
jgi:DNA-directed RNA polymerase subunit E'/Rpb7